MTETKNRKADRDSLFGRRIFHEDMCHFNRSRFKCEE
jgi:hypothetical protein